jgi:hypothetical protein
MLDLYSAVSTFTSSITSETMLEMIHFLIESRNFTTDPYEICWLCLQPDGLSNLSFVLGKYHIQFF